MNGYSWGWLHPSAGAHPPVLTVRCDGRLLFDDIPPERAGDVGYQPRRETWRDYVARAFAAADGDRLLAVPRIIAAHAAGRPPTPDEIAAVRRLTRSRKTRELDATTARQAIVDAQPPTGRQADRPTNQPGDTEMTATETPETPAPARAKSGRCQVCDVDVNLKRGKIADHPAKGRPKEICNGAGLRPAPLPADSTVLEPTLDVQLVAAGRPDGAWAGAEAVVLDPALCDPDANNPRVDLGDISELAASLIAQGMLEPIIVAPGPADGRYTIVAGHRRIAAAIAANLPEIPALVRADLIPGSNLSLAAQVVENLHRRPLSPLEEARAYDLLRQLGMKQADIATAVGVNQGQVSKRLALLKLPDDIAVRVGAGDDGEGVDVAAALDAARLPAATRDKAYDAIRSGVDADRAVRTARAEADKAAAHQAVIDDLETRRVAVVDFPTGWHWTRDREDRPLLTGVDGNRQPYAGSRTLDVPYVDHADLPCHGATVSPRDEVVYVCLDPTRHGYLSPADEEAAEQAEEAARTEASEAAKAAETAKLQARHDAARMAALADVKRPTMLDAVADWTVTRLRLEVTHEWFVGEPIEALGLLLEWTDLAAIPADDTVEDVDAGLVRARLDALTAHHGALRLAWMTVVAIGETLLDQGAYYVGQLADDPALVAHYNRLVEFGGYVLDQVDLEFLEPPVDLGPPALPAEEPPLGAIAWYAPTADALDAGDVPRWITDLGELEAISAGAAARLIVIEPPVPTDELDLAASPDPVGTDEENASSVDEADDSTASDGLPAAPEFDVDPPKPSEAAMAATDDLEPPVDLAASRPVAEATPVPGELCPASRRAFNIAGDAHGVPCPLKCGALVETTKTGRVRDHDVPDPEAATV